MKKQKTNPKEDVDRWVVAFDRIATLNSVKPVHLKLDSAVLLSAKEQEEEVFEAQRSVISSTDLPLSSRSRILSFLFWDT
jgi:hypothetical protein